MAETNPNLSPGVTHQPSLLGGAENIKLLFDEELDNRRETLALAPGRRSRSTWRKPQAVVRRMRPRSIMP
jgi:hypothetical protein